MLNLRVGQAIASALTISLVVLPTTIPAIAQPASTASSSNTSRVRWVPRQSLGSVGSTLSGGRRTIQSAATCESMPGQAPTTLTLWVPENQSSLFTTAERPTVFWDVKTTQPVTLKWMIADPTQAQPLHSQVLQVRESQTMQMELPIALPVGKRYRWSVMVACGDGAGRELYARSFIERIASGPTVTGASVMAQAAIAAQNGLWYDAVATLAKAQQRTPADRQLHTSLKDLLQQANSQLVNR